MPFPGGIKGYHSNPAAILHARPACPACGAVGMHVHERCQRNTDIEGQPARTHVFRLRCPACGRTTRVLPDQMLPWLQAGLATVARGCEAVLDLEQSYRSAALAIGGAHLPLGESLSTFWGAPGAPSPGPSVLFRWVNRLARGAGSWWSALLAEAQRRADTAILPPDPPPRPAAMAHSTGKAVALCRAWHVLWLARGLASRLRIGSWAAVLMAAPVSPRGLDRTGWFARDFPRPP